MGVVRRTCRAKLALGTRPSCSIRSLNSTHGTYAPLQRVWWFALEATSFFDVEMKCPLSTYPKDRFGSYYDIGSELALRWSNWQAPLRHIIISLKIAFGVAFNLRALCHCNRVTIRIHQLAGSYRFVDSGALLLWAELSLLAPKALSPTL
jgi:hypothetical protein